MRKSRQLANTSFQKTPRQPEDVIYAAGLFDGEGFISLGNTGYKPQNPNFVAGQYRLSICVSMCDFQAVKWLHKTFGGRLQLIPAQQEKWRDALRWTLETDDAIAFLREIAPYLKVKNHQTALTFKFRELVKQARYIDDPQRAKRVHEIAKKVQAIACKGRAAHRETVETTRSAPAIAG